MSDFIEHKQPRRCGKYLKIPIKMKEIFALKNERRLLLKESRQLDNLTVKLRL